MIRRQQRHIFYTTGFAKPRNYGKIVSVIHRRIADKEVLL